MSTCGLVLLIALVPLTPSAAQAQGPADYVIGAQDVLAIAVFDQPDLSGKFTVEADGTFTFPLVGRVTAGGLTLRRFEAELRGRLADGYFKNPQVSVGVEQYRSQRIFVVGEVRQPGTFPLTGGMRLIEALARAGSTMPSASGEVVVVRSPGDSSGPAIPNQASAQLLTASIRDLQAGNLAHNIELRNGDTVFVPRAEYIYVFGEVRSPGTYPIQRDTTVLQALSLAGGLTGYGAMNRVKTVRIVKGRKVEIKLRPTDIVQPGDTLIVPRRFF